MRPISDVVLWALRHVVSAWKCSIRGLLRLWSILRYLLRKRVSLGEPGGKLPKNHVDLLRLKDGSVDSPIISASVERPSSSQCLALDQRVSEVNTSSNPISPNFPGSHPLGPEPYRSPSSDAIPSTSFPIAILREAGEIAPPTVIPEAQVNIFPITTTWIERYARGVVIPKVDSQFKIPPYTTSFQRDQDLPGWTSITHPEGALYFYHEEKNIFTDAYLYDPDVLISVNGFVQQIEDKVRATSVSLHSTVELVLELLPAHSDGRTLCGYYFVDHQSRTLFWPEEFHAGYILREVKGATSLTHIRHQIESEYWSHWDLFPNRDVTPDLVVELREILLHAAVDAMTSNTTTTPYSADELRDMLSLVGHIKTSTDGKRHGHSACLMGRMMTIFFCIKFLHFHGENGARLEPHQSIHGETVSQRSLLISLLSPLLFNAPDAHLRTLNHIYVDQLVSLGTWKRYLGKLSDGWQGFTLFGTVLLNANVAFLAIPTVDRGLNVSTRSAAQLASYVSIMTSIASIILGLMLLRQNRPTTSLETPLEAAAYLDRMSHPTLGFEPLAIMYSLPYSLLMWGMLSFLLSFLFMCMFHSDKLTRAFVGVAWFVVFGLVVICILEGREDSWLTRRWLWESGREMLRNLTRNRMFTRRHSSRSSAHNDSPTV